VDVETSTMVVGAIMRVICAWCQNDGIETIIQEGDSDGPISHGICGKHQEDMLKELEKMVITRLGNPIRRRRRRKR